MMSVTYKLKVTLSVFVWNMTLIRKSLDDRQLRLIKRPPSLCRPSSNTLQLLLLKRKSERHGSLTLFNKTSPSTDTNDRRIQQRDLRSQNLATNLTFGRRSNPLLFVSLILFQRQQAISDSSRAIA